MEEIKLTERQQREREFYDKFSLRCDIGKVTFDPVLGEEKRPWNSYWFIYEFALKEYYNGRRKLLDFGCGNGIASLRFAKIGYEVWGFDISPNNIDIAKNLAKKYGFNSHIFYSVQVAEHLSYPPEEFDIITGFDILHHVDIEQSIKECFRILKNNGVAIFREHVEVPVFDKLRNTRIIKALFPNVMSFEKHITEDERKLSTNDIQAIKKIFPNISTQRFEFLSRLDRFFRNPDDIRPSFLEKIDYYIFNHFPLLRHLGGSIVLILKK